MKHSLLLLSIMVLLLTSCSKNKDHSPGGTPNNTTRVKTSIHDYGTANYIYDAQGRVTTLSYSDGSKKVYEWNSNEVNITYYNSAGIVTYAGKYELNPAGLVIKKTYTNDPSSVTAIDYNADKTIAKLIWQDNNSTDSYDYFYTNGNLDSVRYKYNGSLGYTFIYDYYTDKPDLMSGEVFGETFEGKLGKYLLKSTTTRTAAGATATESYSYEFDAQGRVSKKNTHKNQTLEVVTFSYY